MEKPEQREAGNVPESAPHEQRDQHQIEAPLAVAPRQRQQRAGEREQQGKSADVRSVLRPHVRMRRESARVLARRERLEHFREAHAIVERLEPRIPREEDEDGNELHGGEQGEEHREDRQRDGEAAPLGRIAQAEERIEGDDA